MLHILNKNKIFEIIINTNKDKIIIYTLYLRARGEGGGRGCDGLITSPTQWT